jgi:flagella basal body P-ring formation protein FlgA
MKRPLARPVIVAPGAWALPRRALGPCIGPTFFARRIFGAVSPRRVAEGARTGATAFVASRSGTFAPARRTFAEATAAAFAAIIPTTAGRPFMSARLVAKRTLARGRRIASETRPRAVTRRPLAESTTTALAAIIPATAGRPFMPARLVGKRALP